jgi:flagellar hook-length control protein FliK
MLSTSADSPGIKSASFSLESIKATSENDPTLRESMFDQIRGGVERTISLNRNRAVIHLNPPELGSVSIRINVGHNNQIHASFIAESIHTHNMIESGMDSLKNSLAQNGFDLGQVNVYLSGGGMHDTGTSHREQEGRWQHQFHTGDRKQDADSSQEAALTPEYDPLTNSGVHVIM